MPITLNHSNISVRYNTGSNYIIETVKSDLYVRDSRIGISSNLTAEPVVIAPATFTESVQPFTHSGGAENQTTYTFTVGRDTICDILVVGGGGSGGYQHGGGGGAGALIYLTDILFASNTLYTVRVGQGGASKTAFGAGNKGFNSSITGGTFGNIYTAEGGGGGGGFNVPQGGSGGSGGGEGGNPGGMESSTTTAAIANNSLYGSNGGTSRTTTSGSNNWLGAGGGGAGSVGQNSTNEKAGNGGAGRTISITGSAVIYAGGGGGSALNSGGINGSGGSGGGGGAAQNGVAGTNGLGGGGGAAGGPGVSAISSGKGGSGIVIIKFKSIAPPLTEGNPITHKTLNLSYTVAQPTYTLNFPVPTTTDILERTTGRGILNNSNLILQGTYDINMTASSTQIVPRTGQYLPFTSTSNLSQNIAFRYHLLNPIKMPEGAQWTYNSSNANVYHLGNVGIGTTNPNYNLDVSGTIFTSTGGYTQTGLTTWTVMSDRRIKENIVKASYDKCLENVKNIDLYSFNFKDNCVNTNDKNQLGFIAQEVQQVYPKAVEVGRMILNTNETINDVLTLNTTQIDYTLYGAVKYLIEKVEMLEQKLEKNNTITNSSNVITNSSNVITNSSNVIINSSNVITNSSNIL